MVTTKGLSKMGRKFTTIDCIRGTNIRFGISENPKNIKRPNISSFLARNRYKRELVESDKNT